MCSYYNCTQVRVNHKNFKGIFSDFFARDYIRGFIVLCCNYELPIFTISHLLQMYHFIQFLDLVSEIENNTDIRLCCKGFFIYFRCVESRRFLLQHDVTVSLPYPPDSRLQRYSSFVNASVCASLFYFTEGSLFLTHVSGSLPILHLCDTTRQHLSKSHFQCLQAKSKG